MIKTSSEYQQETRIRSYEAAADGKAGIAMICNLMQECAAAHADHLGISFEQMQEMQLGWTVARIGVEIRRKPDVREKLTVQTWINGTRGPFAMREFTVSDALSTVIARGTYAWLAVDIKTKRPARPGRLLEGYPPPPSRESLDAPLGKIPDPVEPAVLDSIGTRQSDIDMRQHVNNTRYIAWMEDAIAADGDSRDIVWLNVNFLAETFAGETIEVKAGASPKDENGKIIVLSRAGDGTELTRGLAVFGKYQENGVPIQDRIYHINEETLSAASKIAGIHLTPPERSLALDTVVGFSENYRRRREVSLSNNLGPAEVFIPQGRPGIAKKTAAETPAYIDRRAGNDPAPDLPQNSTDIAYAPLRHLSAWLRRGEITSISLCELYLERLKRYDPVLSCVVTLAEERAYEQAAKVDEELRRGEYRGPLHGIPWGAKDLLDTRGIPTTWGAAPFKERVPESDAAVVTLLEKAGAVLLGKLSLGALAYGDVWFGGKTRNPWNIEQGSSGSSAGSCAAAVAGLAGFCIGSETMGSIVSPSLRCGAAGLRPSFGMVPRTGAMSLSWSYDKLGPICRHVEDLGYVLEAISKFDPEDPGSANIPFSRDPHQSVKGMKVGFDPAWFEDDPKDGIGYGELRETLAGALRGAGAELVEIKLPDLPYDVLFNLITVDAAAAFEELTLSDRDDELVRQDAKAWPNSFRAARFFPAVEYVQLQRFRRLVWKETRPLFESVDAIVSPEQRSDLLVITNSTGQPSLTLRAGFRADGTPYGINLWGRFAGESSICSIGAVLEKTFSVADKRPGDFC